MPGRSRLVIMGLVYRISLIALALLFTGRAVHADNHERAEPEAPTGIGTTASAAGTAGMVVAADPRAVDAALRVLREGGSATDAVIAAQMVLALVEPQSSGIGGGGFLCGREAHRARFAAVRPRNGPGRRRSRPVPGRRLDTTSLLRRRRRRAIGRGAGTDAHARIGACPVRSPPVGFALRARAHARPRRFPRPAQTARPPGPCQAPGTRPRRAGLLL